MAKKATVIAVVNQKGGTGKTTTCENLGGGFFDYQKLKEKEVAKPDSDADYVDDDEDYGYSEEYEDDDVGFIADDEDNELV